MVALKLQQFDKQHKQLNLSLEKRNKTLFCKMFSMLLKMSVVALSLSVALAQYQYPNQPNAYRPSNAQRPVGSGSGNPNNRIFGLLGGGSGGGGGLGGLFGGGNSGGGLFGSLLGSVLGGGGSRNPAAAPVGHYPASYGAYPGGYGGYPGGYGGYQPGGYPGGYGGYPAYGPVGGYYG